MPPKSLDWDDETLMRCLGYLANPDIGTSIEVEIPNERREEFENRYIKATGKEITLPGNKRPYYVWPPGSNKFGIECRVYFSPTAECPQELKEISTSGRGQTQESRINRVELVFRMFEYGFDFDEFDLSDIVARTFRHRDSFREGYELIPGSPKIDLYCQVPKKSIGIRPTHRKVSYEQAPMGQAYTYILHYNELPVWKIGYTSNLRQRIDEINQHLPWEYTGINWTLEYCSELESSDSAYEKEQLLLNKLDRFRGHGERVFCTREIIEKAWRSTFQTKNSLDH